MFFSLGQKKNNGFELQKENFLLVESEEERYSVNFEDILALKQHEIDIERGDIFKGAKM